MGELMTSLLAVRQRPRLRDGRRHGHDRSPGHGSGTRAGGEGGGGGRLADRAEKSSRSRVLLLRPEPRSGQGEGDFGRVDRVHPAEDEEREIQIGKKHRYTTVRTHLLNVTHQIYYHI